MSFEKQGHIVDEPARSDSLYETDFYAWTQQQAALMKAGCLADVDLVNVVEEIESLGRKETSELRSRYKVLLLHILKEVYQPQRSGRSWRTTILNQRLEIARHIEENPSLKSKADGLFETAYADARRLAASETGLPIKTFPPIPPFGREQVQADGWFPEQPDQPSSDASGEADRDFPRLG